MSKGIPKIHQKPVQQGNGKRGVRSKPQQQCIPQCSSVCLRFPNYSNFPFEHPKTVPMISKHFKSFLITPDG